jgi:PTS system nitrogen regulatory IIA component
MLYSDTTTPPIDIVLPDLAVTHPYQALLRLARSTSPYISVDTRIIEQRLMALEKQEGCGIGNGVALPHLRLPGADQFIALFVRNRHRLSFSTVDNTPVDMLCLLVSPADAPADHLRRLSRLTRLLRDETTLSRLRAAESRDVVEVILKNDTPNIRHVA